MMKAFFNRDQPPAYRGRSKSRPREYEHRHSSTHRSKSRARSKSRPRDHSPPPLPSKRDLQALRDRMQRSWSIANMTLTHCPPRYSLDQSPSSVARDLKHAIDDLNSDTQKIHRRIEELAVWAKGRNLYDTRGVGVRDKRDGKRWDRDVYESKFAKHRAKDLYRGLDKKTKRVQELSGKLSRRTRKLSAPPTMGTQFQRSPFIPQTVAQIPFPQTPLYPQQAPPPSSPNYGRGRRSSHASPYMQQAPPPHTPRFEGQGWTEPHQQQHVRRHSNASAFGHGGNAMGGGWMSDSPPPSPPGNWDDDDGFSRPPSPVRMGHGGDWEQERGGSEWGRSQRQSRYDPGHGGMAGRGLGGMDPGLLAHAGGGASRQHTPYPQGTPSGPGMAMSMGAGQGTVWPQQSQFGQAHGMGQQMGGQQIPFPGGMGGQANIYGHGAGMGGQSPFPQGQSAAWAQQPQQHYGPGGWGR